MKKILLFGVLAAALVFAASCATKPPVVEPTPTKKVVSAPEAEYGKAKELRATIAKYDLARYAPDDNSGAEAKFAEGEAAYNKDNDKAKSAFKDAIKGYEAVIEKGFPAYLDDKIAVVEQIKESAEDLKAQVAVERDYDNAVRVYENALEKKDKKDYEESSDLLDEAKERFESVYEETLAKKEKAEQSIAESREMIDELEAAVE